MHRLLSHTTCDAATAGNACWLRGANPGATSMSGAQVLDMLERGSRRGRLHVARPAVEATDSELDSYGGYAKQEWHLRVRYDFPTIVREAIEEELRR